MNATVAELGLAPGKSMRAYSDVEAIEIDSRGLFGDREYMWVEAGVYVNQTYKKGTENSPGRFISQREDTVLTGIVPIATPDGLELAFEGKDRLFVPKAEDTVANRTPVSIWSWDGEAVDQGDQAAEWGSNIIGRHVRLVAVSDQAPRFVEGNPRLGRTGFTDGFAVTVGSTDSFDKINEYLDSKGKPKISFDRTRSTMILDGLEAIGTGEHVVFPEDYIETITLVSNGLEAVLRRWKACGRCPVPDTNQMTGERKTHVRSALGKLGRTGVHADTARYGQDSEIFLTQNFIIELPANMPPEEVFRIDKGAKVSVTMSDTTNWKPIAA